MTQLNHFLGFFYIFVLAVHNQIPETVQETGYTFNTSVIPLCILFRRSYEQFVKS